MSHGMVRWITSTRLGNVLARRPRVALTLALLVLFVAFQGGAAALDGGLPGDGMFGAHGGGDASDNGP